MTIPERTEELLKAAGFWGDAWNSVSSFGQGVAQGVEGVGKVIGDAATGNFSNIGKDVGKTFNSVGKDLGQAGRSLNKATGEGLNDIGKSAVDSARWVKDHKGEIAMGAAALGATVLAVGELGLNPAADALAAGLDTAVIGGEVAAGAAGAAEAGAAGAVAAEAGATGAVAAEAGAAEAAGAAEGYSGAASATSTATEDVAGSASKFQRAQDLLSRIPKPIKKLAPVALTSVGTSEGMSLINAPEAPKGQPAAAPPPQPVQEQPLRSVDLNPTLPGAGTPGSAIPASQAAPLAIAQPFTPVPIPTAAPVLDTGEMKLPDVSTTVVTSSKIIDLVEQFGLYPEDIKNSLTSWR